MIIFHGVLWSMLYVGSSMIVAGTALTQENIPFTANDKNGMHVGPIEHPGATSPSFTLNLRAGSRNKSISEFRIGSKILVTVKMTNITNHPIDHSGSYTDAGDSNYLLDVRDEDGRQVPKIVYAHPELDMLSPFWSDIPSGDSDLDELRLYNVYKFDEPGKYTIQVSRPDPDFLDKNGKPTVIKSNIITITITG